MCVETRSRECCSWCIDAKHFIREQCRKYYICGLHSIFFTDDCALNLFYYVLQQDSFYFNVLPFAKDIGKFQFPSFSRLPSFSQPTEEQQKAADNFVSMLNLAPSGREVLKPEFTPNPMLEVLFFVVEHHVECFYTRLYLSSYFHLSHPSMHL